jgi:hypothetical protein
VKKRPAAGERTAVPIQAMAVKKRPAAGERTAVPIQATADDAPAATRGVGDDALAATRGVGGDDPALLVMGLAGRRYKFAPSPAVALKPLVEAAAAVQATWTRILVTKDLGEAAQLVSEVLTAIQAATGFFNDKRHGYHRAFLTRKIIIARLFAGGETSLKVDWWAVNRDLLCQICADERGYLLHFPADMSAGDISDIVFERCDLGVFVSMWACLWHDVVPPPEEEKKAQKTKKRRNVSPLETVLSFLESGLYEREAVAAHQRHGFWLCPRLTVHACSEGR